MWSAVCGEILDVGEEQREPPALVTFELFVVAGADLLGELARHVAADDVVRPHELLRRDREFCSRSCQRAMTRRRSPG